MQGGAIVSEPTQLAFTNDELLAMQKKIDDLLKRPTVDPTLASKVSTLESKVGTFALKTDLNNLDTKVTNYHKTSYASASDLSTANSKIAELEKKLSSTSENKNLADRLTALETKVINLHKNDIPKIPDIDIPIPGFNIQDLPENDYDTFYDFLKATAGVEYKKGVKEIEDKNIPIEVKQAYYRDYLKKIIDSYQYNLFLCPFSEVGYGSTRPDVYYKSIELFGDLYNNINLFEAIVSEVFTVNKTKPVYYYYKSKSLSFDNTRELFTYFSINENYTYVGIKNKSFFYNNAFGKIGNNEVYNQIEDDLRAGQTTLYNSDKYMFVKLTREGRLKYLEMLDRMVPDNKLQDLEKIKQLNDQFLKYNQ